MKNEILLSTILLLNPVSSVCANEISSIKQSVQQGVQYLAELVFVSPEEKVGTFWRWNSSSRQSTEFEAHYKVRVSFVISRRVDTNDYLYNGNQGSGEMDYEMHIERVHAETGEVLSSQDSVFFAKRLSKNKFRVFDCNSTSNCWDEEGSYYSHADIFVFDTPEGRILKTTKNSQHNFDEYIFEDRVLFEAK